MFSKNLIISIIGIALGIGGSIVSGIASDRKQKEEIRKAVNEVIAESGKEVVKGS